MKMNEYAVKQYVNWVCAKYGPEAAEPKKQTIRLLGVGTDVRGDREVVEVRGMGGEKFSAFKNVWAGMGVDIEPLREGDECEVTYLQAPGSPYKNMIGFRQVTLSAEEAKALLDEIDV